MRAMEYKKLLSPLWSSRIRHLFAKSFQRFREQSSSENGKERRAARELIASEDVLSLLERQYGFSLIERPAEIFEGMENSVWSVKTEQGEWIVKVHTSTRSFSRIRQEARIYEFLNARGCRAPLVEQTIGHSSVGSLTVDGCAYPVTVMRLEASSKRDASTIGSDQFDKITMAYARLHQILKDYPGREQLFRFSDYTQPNDAFRKLLASGYGALLGSDELKSYESLSRRMAGFLETHSTSGQLTHTVLHGDMSLDHALFLSEGEVYFFDFGDHSWGPIAFDLAVFLVSLFMTRISAARWKELITRFMQTYLSIGELSAEDLRAIKPFMILRLRSQIAFLCEAHLPIGPELVLQRIRRSYRLADSLLRAPAEETGKEFRTQLSASARYSSSGTTALDILKMPSDFLW